MVSGWRFVERPLGDEARWCTDVGIEAIKWSSFVVRKQDGTRQRQPRTSKEYSVLSLRDIDLCSWAKKEKNTRGTTTTLTESAAQGAV